MTPDKFSINWFDFVVLATLVIGILRGRKNGMSEELLPVIQWLVIVFGSAYLYDGLGVLLAQSAAFSLLSAYVVAYLVIAIVIKSKSSDD